MQPSLCATLTTDQNLDSIENQILSEATNLVHIVPKQCNELKDYRANQSSMHTKQITDERLT